MNKSKIIFVSHCILNTSSKVFHKNKKITEEEINRIAFLKKCMDKNIQLVQLPCPELLVYGTKRWGHSKDQFDNPFFKEKCKEMLNSFILQMKAYLSEPNKFHVLGILGIEGSPSCGISISFCGDWGGEFSSCSCIDDVIKSGYIKQEKGVFMEVLEELLKSNNILLPMFGLKDNILNEFLN